MEIGVQNTRVSESWSRLHYDYLFVSAIQLTIAIIMSVAGGLLLQDEVQNEGFAPPNFVGVLVHALRVQVLGTLRVPSLT